MLFFLSLGGSIGVTVAGNTGDIGPWSYQFSSPTQITFDQYGFLYVMDNGNLRIQRWYPGATFGSTVVAATMSNPLGMSFDRLNNLYIADTNYHRVLLFPITCRKSISKLIYLIINILNLFLF